MELLHRWQLLVVFIYRYVELELGYILVIILFMLVLPPVFLVLLEDICALLSH